MKKSPETFGRGALRRKIRYYKKTGLFLMLYRPQLNPIAIGLLKFTNPIKRILVKIGS